MPEKDEFLRGHKYPFNSCEILCSDNGLNISKLLGMPLGKLLKEKNKKINANKNINEENKDIKKKKKEININEKDKIEEKKNEKVNGQKNEENNKQIKNTENNNEKSLNEKSNKENNKEKYEIKSKINSNEVKNNLINENKEKNEERKENKEEKEKKELEKKEENKVEKEKREEEEKKEEIQEEKNENKKEKEEEIQHFDDVVASINDAEEEKEDLEKEHEEEIIDEKENEKIINEEIFSYLFSFIDNKSSIENPVISGYFTKITNFLLKRNTKMILEYFFKKNEKIFNKYLSKIGQPSIGNIIENILNALFENIISDSDKYVKEILDYILDLISKDETNDETVGGIYQLLNNSIIYNNKLQFCNLIESSFVKKLNEKIKKLYENKEKNTKKIIYMIELLTKMNNNILTNLEKRITPNLNFDAGKIEIINIIKAYDRNSFQYFSSNENKANSQNIFNIYKAYLQNYCISLNEICLIIINDILNDNNLGKDTTKFGINNITKFEFICSVIDLHINNLQFEVEQRTFTTEKLKEIIKTKIFKKINELYFIYKNNNMFSNIYSQIIKIITNELSPKELIGSILLIEENNQKKNLTDIIINDLITNLKYIFEESKNEMYNLFFSHEINILNDIFSSNNEYIKEIIEKDKNGKFFYEMMIKNIMNQFNKKLFKINDNIEQKKVDIFNPYFDAQKEQSDTNIPFSLQSFSEIVSLFLLVYQKYIKNEEYETILKENEELLEVSIIIFYNIKNILEKEKRTRIFRAIGKRKKRKRN